MRVKVHNSEDLAELFIASVINNTDKVSKVSLHSALSAIGFGVGKVGEKALKEVALFESRKFPSFARKDDLDFAAGEFGVSPRYGSSGSSAVLRVVADAGTVYNKLDHEFSGSNGISFEMTVDSVEISDHGFAFIPVRSASVGSETNVIANSILRVTPAPQGHQFVTNDFMATGGRDVEDDVSFRYRIKDSGNRAASTTIGKLTQALMSLDNDVLRIIHKGFNSSGQVVLAILAKNGKLFTSEELSYFLEETERYFSLDDIRPSGSSGSYGVSYVNVEYYPIDIDFRAVVDEAETASVIRKRIQMSMNRLIDYRQLKASYKFEWDDALDIVKRSKGIRYVPDVYFMPNSDIQVPSGMIPRFRQFIMRNSDGVIVSDSGAELSPVYFPNLVDIDYQNTFL